MRILVALMGCRVDTRYATAAAAIAWSASEPASSGTHWSGAVLKYISFAMGTCFHAVRRSGEQGEQKELGGVPVSGEDSGGLFGSTGVFQVHLLGVAAISAQQPRRWSG